MHCSTQCRSRWCADGRNSKEKEVLNRRAYRVNEVTQALGLGRTTVYKLINRGDLRRIKVGATTLIAADSVEALLQRDAA